MCLLPLYFSFRHPRPPGVSLAPIETNTSRPPLIPPGKNFLHILHNYKLTLSLVSVTSSIQTVNWYHS